MVKKIAIVFILVSFILNLQVHRVDASFDCLTINNGSSQTDRDFCRNELNQIEAQLTELLKQQAEQQKHTGTIKGDINLLTTQINSLKTKVKARALKIAQLKVDIKDKVVQITTLSAKIDREHQSLAQLLRNTNDFDKKDFIYLVFSDENLSAFYNDLESYNSIKQAIKRSVDQINGIKTQTEVQKTELEKKQDAETDAKAELENAQKKVTQTETEKKKLLAISKQKESEYQKLTAEKKAIANKIRSALFNLIGTSEKIDFGTAFKYANEAKDKFNIDPVFLLAVFKKETNLGSNIGQCYLTDVNTGNGKGVSNEEPKIRVMNPTRDIPVFLDIVSKLGLNYTATRVSCWIKDIRKGVPFGWGGAMGPAQFIPSTWKGFENRLKNTLGYEASPWSPRDAFMASAMYLTDLGAIGTSTSAQSRAACSYYGTKGSSCAYSRGVMSFKAGIQSDIDLLSS